MTPEQDRALKVAIDRVYPELADAPCTRSLSGNDPWSGTLTFHLATHTQIAVVRFTMSGRNGGPQLMIERDWND
ncbi:hypothetical protein PAGU2196_11660 [Pseudomonas sp. PAGU 2196]|nr:hypothetical protein PAGU2196_11660 [Pseudomonas sp. PAGU 2196]